MADIPKNAHFWAAMLRRVRRRLGDQDDAEDLLHDAYIRLEQYRAEQTISNPAGFIVRAAVNINLDNHRHNSILAEQSFDTQVLELIDKSPLQDEVMEARARLQRVMTGLARLSPRTREIFLMHRVEEMKYREIATRLGISQSAVEKHIAKAVWFLTDWTDGW